MKKISVLTPTYNAGAYLERAIANVLRQDYPAVEHIVVDGGSTDNTVEILKRHPHLIWVSEKDRGQSDAMNKAFALSTGEVIVYLNADDYFEEGIFKKVMAEFEQNPGIDIIVGNGVYTGPGGNTGGWRSEAEYHKCLRFYNYQFPVNPVSYFYRRRVQDAVLYNVNNQYAMDYEFLLRSFQLFTAKKTEENFGFFYQDGTNKTADAARAYQELKKTLFRHCLRYDKLQLLPALGHFIGRKLFGAK